MLTREWIVGRAASVMGVTLSIDQGGGKRRGVTMCSCGRVFIEQVNASGRWLSNRCSTQSTLFFSFFYFLPLLAYKAGLK